MYNVISKAPNEVILTAGTLEPYIYIVKSGQLRAVRKKNDKMATLAELGPGDFIGEMAHLGTHKEHSATVITVTKSELVQIEAAQFYDVIAENPVWLKALLQNLVKKLENANQKLDSTKKVF